MTLRWLYVVAFVSTLIQCSASANAQVSACPFNTTSPARGAVSDTLLQQRFAQNVSGDAAFVGGTGATSTSASSIRGNIQTLLPRLDIDGDGQITNFDSQVAARIRLGYTVQAAVAGLTPVASGSRNTVALVAAFLNAGCPAPASSGVQYWVSKTGNDSNACTQASPCLTIQRGISLLQPGDTLNIRAGTYVENSAASVHTRMCDWIEGVLTNGRTQFSLCFQTQTGAPVSGTQSAPITIRAAPGDERNVILDGQNERAAIYLMRNDYITLKGLKFVNTIQVGIANETQIGNVVPNVPGLAIGVRVEDCWFDGVRSLSSNSANVAAIAMWASKDWVVRNNLIEGVSGSGIQSYGLINALIEQNTIRVTGNGVLWKDHFLQLASPRTLVQESEIRYNDITSSAENGIRIQPSGTGAPEAGHSYIHHNIIRSHGSGIVEKMNEAPALSGDLRIEHNVIDCQNAPETDAISASASRSLAVTGNILVRCGVGLSLPYNLALSPAGLRANLTASDKNVWDSRFHNVADYPSGPYLDYYSLTDWRSVTATRHLTVKIANPDANSVTSNFSSLFLNSTTYAYSATSLANGLVGVGRNAGPYEIGNERIGADF